MFKSAENESFYMTKTNFSQVRVLTEWVFGLFFFKQTEYKDKKKLKSVEQISLFKIVLKWNEALR